jgi:transposase-like protein
MEAERLLRTALEAWHKEHLKLALWAKEAIPESLTVFDFPNSDCVRLRTTNGLERITGNCADARAWRASSRNPGSCLRLVSAMLAKLEDESDPQGLSQPQYITLAS